MAAMNRAAITESDAVAIVRAEGRRMTLLGAMGLLVAMAIYLLVSILLLDRPPGEAVARMLPVLVAVALLAYFFQLPRWVRRPRTEVTRATVGRVTQDEVTLQGGPQGEVSVVLPRGTTGFRRGDRVWVSPDLMPAQTVAVIVPGHVTSPRPVISGRAVAVRR